MIKNHLPERRNLIKQTVVALLASVISETAFAKSTPIRIVFVHGRGQGDKNQDELKDFWTDILQSNLESRGVDLSSLEIEFPFYGKLLDDFAAEYSVPLNDDIGSRGAKENKEFLQFQAEMLDEMTQAAGITEEQIDAEYDGDVASRGPQNWKWVHAVLRALDKNAEGLTAFAMETFLRDVFLYTKYTKVSDAVDKVVTGAFSTASTIVVGHSLGTVVAFNVIRKSESQLNIPAFITLGSPLGIKYISKSLRPYSRPESIKNWLNAYDKRDVVALNPLNLKYFPVKPEIINYSEVDNHTENRHSISGYLDDPFVGQSIADVIKS